MITENARQIFQKNLHRISKDRGLSQVEIANALHLTPSTVSGWFLGNRYPRIDAMQHLADLLEVSMRDLTTETDGELVMSTDERHVLSVYRSLTAEGRKQFMVQLTMVANMFTDEKNNSVPISGTLK